MYITQRVAGLAGICYNGWNLRRVHKLCTDGCVPLSARTPHVSLVRYQVRGLPRQIGSQTVALGLLVAELVARGCCDYCYRYDEKTLPPTGSRNDLDY